MDQEVLGKQEDTAPVTSRGGRIFISERTLRGEGTSDLDPVIGMRTKHLYAAIYPRRYMEMLMRDIYKFDALVPLAFPSSLRAASTPRYRLLNSIDIFIPCVSLHFYAYFP